MEKTNERVKSHLVQIKVDRIVHFENALPTTHPNAKSMSITDDKIQKSADLSLNAIKFGAFGMRVRNLIYLGITETYAQHFSKNPKIRANFEFHDRSNVNWKYPIEGQIVSLVDLRQDIGCIVMGLGSIPISVELLS